MKKKRLFWITNRLPHTYMYLIGHKIQTITIQGNSVDQSSRKSLGNLVHEYQKCKTVPWGVRFEKRSTISEKTVEWPHPWLLFELIGLNSWEKAASINNIYPFRLALLDLKVLNFVFKPVKVAEHGHSMEASEITRKRKLWGLQSAEINSLLRMAHLWRCNVFWRSRELICSSYELSYRE